MRRPESHAREQLSNLDTKAQDDSDDVGEGVAELDCGVAARSLSSHKSAYAPVSFLTVNH